ncbi:hypothetical protein L6164_014206 [Bauhinia variegata]|uniref:Uncharacterized protein n=1 Tax=Bauhinia variegata TaxID=167791 RepID=A0ACB9NLD7_BAUVA|nr:hypothetical protein L6164_014206 [Bauhinia variegata]
MPNLEEGNILIREVWSDNLDYELKLISDIVDQYPYVAVDTEFPGQVLAPLGSVPKYNYQKMKLNVDLLKLIQLGLTFSDEKGNLPTCGTDKFCIWQINFREFKLDEDPHAEDSIKMLSENGMDYRRNNENGVDVRRFSELLLTSGVVMNDDVRVITFHGLYDLGFLVKLLKGTELPNTEAEFLNLVKIYVPNLYDIKHLIKYCSGLFGGLNKVASILGVRRLVGLSHQAGSDSLVTCCTFMKLIEVYFRGKLPDEKYAGVLFSLGDEYRYQNPR